MPYQNIIKLKWISFNFRVIIDTMLKHIDVLTTAIIPYIKCIFVFPTLVSGY